MPHKYFFNISLLLRKLKVLPLSTRVKLYLSVAYRPTLFTELYDSDGVSIFQFEPNRVYAIAFNYLIKTCAAGILFYDRVFSSNKTWVSPEYRYTIVYTSGITNR